MNRPQNKTRRILLLIDALAPLRSPFTAVEARLRLEERVGSSIDVCERTIRRDLDLLVSMGLAEVHRKHVPVGRGSDAGYMPTLYRMNLRMTTHAEMAAIKVSDG